MARYKELRDILTEEIAGGVYPVGAKFPTDYELCDRFRVSRHTVREALRGLQDQGLLSRQAGSGTTVLACAPATLYTQTVGSLSELFDYAVADTRFEQRHEGFVVLRQALADLLGREVGERWLRFAGVRWLTREQVALCWTEIFIAQPYFAIREQRGDDPAPLYDQIQRAFGLEITEVEQRISAIAMPPDIAPSLNSEADAPALVTRRRYFAGGPNPFEISLSLHPGDRYAYTQRLARDHGVRPSPASGDVS